MAALNFVEHATHRARPHDVVAAEQPAIVARRGLDGFRHVAVDAAFLRLAHIFDIRMLALVTRENFRGVVGRSAVENDDLHVIPAVLTEDRIQSLRNEFREIIDGNADGKAGGHRR